MSLTLTLNYSTVSQSQIKSLLLSITVISFRFVDHFLLNCAPFHGTFSTLRLYSNASWQFSTGNRIPSPHGVNKASNTWNYRLKDNLICISSRLPGHTFNSFHSVSHLKLLLLSYCCYHIAFTLLTSTLPLSSDGLDIIRGACVGVGALILKYYFIPRTHAHCLHHNHERVAPESNLPPVTQLSITLNFPLGLPTSANTIVVVFGAAQLTALTNNYKLLQHPHYLILLSQSNVLFLLYSTQFPFFP